MQIYQVLNLDVTKFSILMRSKFSGSHASLNIVTLCSEYVCTCHDMTLYGRVTLLVHTGERIRVWYGRVSHGIFTQMEPTVQLKYTPYPLLVLTILRIYP